MENRAHDSSDAAHLRALVARARAALSCSSTTAADGAADIASRAAAAHPDIAVEACLIRIEALRRLNQTPVATSVTLDALVIARDLPQPSELVDQLHRWHVILRVSEGRAVLTLAAAGKALRSPGRCTAAKSDVYAAAARAYGMLGCIDRGFQVMQERVLPMAFAAGDPETLSGAVARMAGLLHVYACSAAGIGHDSLRCGHPTRLGNGRRRLIEAKRLLAQCERLQPKVSLPGKCFFLAMSGLVESQLNGINAGRERFEAGLRLADAANTRSRMLLCTAYGHALRGAERHEEAIERLGLAEVLAMRTEDKAALCEISYELALCHRALGNQALADASMSVHVRLHTQRGLAALEWSTDPRWLLLFGQEPELDALRRQLLTSDQPAALDRADEYISGNLARRLSVPEIARHSGVSARSLQSLYRQYQGCPVSHVVRRRRMSLARQLLADGKLSVATVADCIGYSVPANFSRDFKARYGCSPATARDSSLTLLDEFLTLGA
jgi:AraC-like DNA-binding protein